jgi:phage host-nuclease inhibitor protein Gam
VTNKTKLKAKAAAYTPQTKDECAAGITKLGDLQREQARRTGDMNDEIAVITARYQPELEERQARITVLQEGVQTWCEGHRSELTDCGKTKTANLVTGEVSWRQRPPSVMVRGAEAVIETLKRLGLSKFIRNKEEINKEAILNEPNEVRGVAGLNVVCGVEDFTITPFEQQAA